MARFADTLTFLHEKGIVHRDLKPENLYRHDGQWKVGDFGLVSFPNKEPVTAQGRWLGPLHFMAPEMVENPTSADGRSADVYSLAKTLWVLATGQTWPPPGEQRVDVPALTVSMYRSGAAVAKLDLLLERATRTDPKLRPSMRSFAEELGAWLSPAFSPLAPDDVSSLLGRLKSASEGGMRRDAAAKRLLREAEGLERSLGATLAGSAYAKAFLAADESFRPKLGSGRNLLEKCSRVTPGLRMIREGGSDLRMSAPCLSPGGGSPTYFHLVGGCGFRLYDDGAVQFVYGHMVFSGHYVHRCFANEELSWVGSAGMERLEARMLADLSASFPRALECFTRSVEVGTIPQEEPDVRIAGLSEDASSLARFLARSLDHPSGHPPDVAWETLEAETRIRDRALRDALQELERLQYVRVVGDAGAPHGIALVVGTVFLGEMLAGVGLLSFDPRRDARGLCRALLEHDGMIAMAAIFSRSGLTAARFNFALDHLVSHDLATVHEAPSIGSIRGGRIERNARTRSFADGGE